MRARKIKENEKLATKKKYSITDLFLNDCTGYLMAAYNTYYGYAANCEANLHSIQQNATCN